MSTKFSNSFTFRDCYNASKGTTEDIEQLQTLEAKHLLLGDMKTVAAYAAMRKRLEKRLHETQQTFKSLTGQPNTPLDARNSDLQDLS